MSEVTLEFWHTVCPRYWARLWRYRWITHCSVLQAGEQRDVFIVDGYAWTQRGVASAGLEWEREVREILERPA